MTTQLEQRPPAISIPMHLACSKSGDPMQVTVVEPTEPDHEWRMFECTSCQYFETMIVKYR
jgi:hypothetical protein